MSIGNNGEVSNEGPDKAISGILQRCADVLCWRKLGAHDFVFHGGDSPFIPWIEGGDIPLPPNPRDPLWGKRGDGRENRDMLGLGHLLRNWIQKPRGGMPALPIEWKTNIVNAFSAKGGNASTRRMFFEC